MQPSALEIFNDSMGNSALYMFWCKSTSAKAYSYVIRSNMRQIRWTVQKLGAVSFPRLGKMTSHLTILRHHWSHNHCQSCRFMHRKKTIRYITSDQVMRILWWDVSASHSSCRSQVCREWWSALKVFHNIHITIRGSSLLRIVICFGLFNLLALMFFRNSLALPRCWQVLYTEM